MKYILAAALAVGLAGCSSSVPRDVPAPVYKLRGFDGPDAMTDAQVLLETKKCVFNKLHPNIEYMTVRVDGGGGHTSKVLVPIAVHCEPVM
jgi:hypothetical protein